MKVKLLKLILVIFACIAAGCGKKESSMEHIREDNLHALILSDLHFTANREANDSIVPLMHYCEEFMETVVKEVTDIHPDVLIVTGDNTNDGADRDEQILAGYLQRIKDAGIPVVMTTGNHDFGFTGPDTYRKNYQNILDMKDRDPDSLSYTYVVNDILLISMDDNALPAKDGSFSQNTVKWLNKKLAEAEKEGRTVLLLTHHPLFAGAQTRESAKEVVSLMKKYDVKLCLSGHTHSQSISKYDGMYEITSAMPLSGLHLIGDLRIENGTVEYHAEPVDFEKYGDDEFADIVRRKDQENSERTTEIFAKIIADAEVKNQEAVSELIMRYFKYYGEGTIGMHADEIREDPAYDEMMRALAPTNYGPWMEYVLNDPPMRSDALTISLEETK